VKVYRMNEVTEYVAAGTASEAQKWYRHYCIVDCGMDPSEVENEPAELTAAAMERMIHVGEGVEEPPYPRSFRDELDALVKSGVEFPLLFASSEF